MRRKKDSIENDGDFKKRKRRMASWQHDASAPFMNLPIGIVIAFIKWCNFGGTEEPMDNGTPPVDA